MSESTVAIVGSGIVGTTMAYLLTRRGHDVVIFEKGPDYPYPHAQQFRETQFYAYWNDAYRLPPDLKNLTVSGGVRTGFDGDRGMVVGGSATHWGAVTLRMPPPDFKTRSRYGYGADWPLSYEDIETHYCDAEWLLGVSGTDADNPFAPRRSRPYPLPPFELSYDDRILAEKLHRHDLVVHTTPQARTRHAYEQRPGCMNFGTCEVCPIGVRYSPNYHLRQAMETGRCQVLANTSVRRMVVDEAGRVRALVYQPNDAATEREHAAKVIIVAAGTIESARLLLLSSRDRHPDGIRLGAHVGQHFMVHHSYSGRVRYRDALRPGSLGAVTATSGQFLDPPGRGKVGGMLVFFSSNNVVQPEGTPSTQTAREIVEAYSRMRHWRDLSMQAESDPTAQKYVTLSSKRDRFGDPFANVHYEPSDFDRETYRFGRRLFDRFAAATGADEASLAGVDLFDTAAHHVGTCRMGLDASDSVVDSFGKVHGTANLFVVGGSNLVSMGAVQPTLTMVAVAMRTARYLMDRVLPSP
jgi:glucose dehydrogenase